MSKPTPSKPAPADLSALADAFAGVQRLGAPPPKRPPSSAAPPPAPPARQAVAPPAPAARPAVAPPSAPPPRPAPDDLQLLAEAMKGVRRAGEPPRTQGAPPRPPPPSAPVARPAGPTPGARTGPPVAKGAPSLVDELHQRAEQLSADNEGLRRSLAATEAARASAEAALRAARAELDLAGGGERELRRRLLDAEAALRAGEEREAGLRSELDAARAEALSHQVAAAAAVAAQLRAEAAQGAPTPLRELLAARGLLGEDEHRVALRGLLEARRERPLLEQLRVADSSLVTTFLAERLTLHADGEAVPPSKVGVLVPPSRSELREDGAVKQALSRFSTVCLIHGVKRLLFVGGSPAYRRTLKEGLDRRLDVRFVEGDRLEGARAQADVVIVWGGTELDHSVSNRFPDAMVVAHRGLVGMLREAADRLDSEQ